MKRAFLIGLWLLGACDDAESSASAAVEAQPLDTAVLYPLPASLSSSTLLTADAEGEKGALLPAYARGELPALSDRRNNAALFPTLRLVAFNLDPCFPTGRDGAVNEEGGSLCRKQIRLIFQPVVEGEAGITTEDVTLHTFHEMDVDTFREMVVDMVALRGGTSLEAEPIDVHPLAGDPEFVRGLNELVLRYAGADNLVKVTFSGLRGGGIGWQMGAINFVGESGRDAVIAATTVTRQEMVNAGPAVDFAATVEPITEFSERLEPLFDSATARTADDAVVEAAYREALRIDNPETDLHPDTVDCASCHLATPVRLWAERNRGLSAADYPEDFRHERWNLENRSRTKENTASTRCFGYFGADVSISQRTVNESAAVADFINEKILGGAR